VWIWGQLKPFLPQLCQIEVFETTDNCVIYRGA
jgi:6-pyruvoyltetrahydropterin/6-carboxytetrahydropterin synthase